MIKKIKFSIVLSLFTMASFGQRVEVDQVRQMYLGGWEGLCGAVELSTLITKTDAERSPVLMAYKGAAISTTANCKKMPFAKWNTFNEGKAMIEQAIALAPSNVEVRFIRFTVQSNIPGFLNYNHLDEDKQFIFNSLKSATFARKTGDLMSLILDYLRVSDHLGAEEKIMVESIIAKR